MGEGLQVGDDGFDAADALLDVLEDFLVFGALVGGEEFGLVSQGVEPGGGVVQGVVDFVDDARAHAAERDHLLGLHQQGFGFLQLLDGGFEHLVLPGELVLVMMRLDEVFDAHVQFGGGKGLGQKIVRAGGERGQLGFLIRAGGQDDDRDVAAWRLARAIRGRPAGRPSPACSCPAG